MKHQNQIKQLEGKKISHIEILAANSIVIHTTDGLVVEVTADSKYLAGVSIPLLDFYSRTAVKDN